jgi:hypothetical protein
MKQNDAVLNLRIATELHDQLKALAQSKYMPLSVMVRLALMDYIKQEAPNTLTTQPYQAKPEKKYTGSINGVPISEIMARRNAPQSPSQQLSEDDWA